MDAWADRELGDGSFPDLRLRARLGKILGDLGRRIGGTLPAACQDWAALPVIDAALALGRLTGLAGKDEVIWLRACLGACTGFAERPGDHDLT
jgi:hypothetical protein